MYLLRLASGRTCCPKPTMGSRPPAASSSGFASAGKATECCRRPRAWPSHSSPTQGLLVVRVWGPSHQVQSRRWYQPFLLQRYPMGLAETFLSVRSFIFLIPTDLNRGQKPYTPHFIWVSAQDSSICNFPGCLCALGFVTSNLHTSTSSNVWASRQWKLILPPSPKC